MMKPTITALGAIFFALLTPVLPGATRILLNEVHIDPPDVNTSDLDGDYDYVEVIAIDDVSKQPVANQSLDDVWILIVDSKGGSIGEVKKAWRLAGVTTGSNGIAFIGNGFDSIPQGGVWSNFVALETTCADPSGFGQKDIPNTDNEPFTILLVRNFTGTATTGTTPGTDLVTTDTNRTMNLAPWSEQLDAIGIADRTDDTVRPALTFPSNPASSITLDPAYNSTKLKVKTALVGNISRLAGNVTKNSPSAWYGGDYSSSSDPTTTQFLSTKTFGTGFSSSAPGEATPGRPNLSGPLPEAIVRINEVNLNPSKDDNNYEYVEIISTNRGNANLSGYSLVVVDSKNDGLPNAKFGEVKEIWPLSKLVTGPNGVLILGNNYGNSGATPWGSYISSASRVADPDGLGDNDIGENDALTMLLVKDLSTSIKATSTSGPGTDLDTDENGVLDGSLSIIDSIGFDQIGGTTNVAEVTGSIDAVTLTLAANQATLSSGQYLTGPGIPSNTYITAVLDTEAPFIHYSINRSLTVASTTITVISSPRGLSYATGKLNIGYDPDNISRIAGNSNANNASAWYGGDFGGASSQCIAFKRDPERNVFGGFKGEATPGRVNLNSEAIPGELRINEVNFSPVDAAGASNESYIEFISEPRGITSLNNLFLITIDNSGASRGVIREAINLGALSTGPNGLLLIGDSYDDLFPYENDAPSSPETPKEDPSSVVANETGYNEGDLGNGEDRIVAIIKGWAGTVGEDWDPNDDGILTIPTSSALVDSITLADVSDSRIAKVPQVAYRPDTVSRYPGQTSANSATSWYGGKFARISEGDLISYGTQYFGSFQSKASPGRYNHSAPFLTASVSPVLINELVLDAPGGGDGNKEFIELISATGQAQSLNGYSLIMIDSTPGDSFELSGKIGEVVAAWSLDGLKTGANGLAVIASGWTVGNIPYTGEAAPSSETAIGEPLGFLPGIIGADNDNGAFSLLLVRDFKGRVGIDLDTVGNTGTNTANEGDGRIDPISQDDPDAPPIDAFSQLVDSLGAKYWNSDPAEPTNSTNTTSPRLEGVVYSSADLSQGNPPNLAYTPDTMARYRGNIVTNNAVSWYGGDLFSTADLTVYDATQRFNPQGTAGIKMTPGQHNLGVVATPLSITTTSLPNGVVGQSYTGSVAATGGTSPYTFIFQNGTPPGLSISSSGSITGTPTQSGTFTVTVRATDSASATATKDFSVEMVCPTLSLTSNNTNAVEGEDYLGQLIGIGGTAPYTFTLVSSSAEWVQLSSSGQITGTPTAHGSVTINISMTDAYNCPGTGSVMITVLPDPMADHDGDGLTTFLEQALGLDPMVANACPPAHVGSVEVSGQTYATISFPLPDGADQGILSAPPAISGGIAYKIQSSSDLKIWTTDTDFILFDKEEGTMPFLLHTFRATTPVGSGQKFLRLHVSKPQ